jgi:uncharacterized membrane protein YqhA
MNLVDRILSQTRYMVIIAVAASLALAAMLFLFGAVHAAGIIASTIAALGDAKKTKALAIASVEIADFFLIATALYIVGIGLYELFIRDLDLPAWLTITSLEELKQRLISVIVVALAVAFLAQVANWDGASNLLPFGAAIAAVVVALGAFSFLKYARFGFPAKTDKGNVPD